MILQGTMQDGTVIPVQVDAQGRLVAEGLQGVPGPAGPQGPQGEKGDPGSGGGGLPPGANEGDVLMWHEGAAIWVSTGGAIKPPQPPPRFDYSNMLTVSQGGAVADAAAMFDGNEGTYAYNDNGGIKFTPANPVSGNWSIKFTTSASHWATVIAQFSDAPLFNQRFDGGANQSWVACGTGTLTAVEIYRDANTRTEWFGVKVNGNLLVDGQQTLVSA